MTDMRFNIDWQSREDIDPFLGQTTANFEMIIANICITQNVDIWSRTTRDHVLVSMYPLAMWIASSWWRLHYEVLPSRLERMPPIDWRLSHEMSAANSGYVWPLVAFSTDREAMNIWAEAFPSDTGQSVRYLTGLNAPVTIPMQAFSSACREFVETVVARLGTTECRTSELAELWSLVVSDLGNPKELQKRRIEAQFGFDPEECPDALLERLIAFEECKGGDVLAELAAVWSRESGDIEHSIEELFSAPGIETQPQLPDFLPRSGARQPWEHAKADAIALRKEIGGIASKIEDRIIADLLGVNERDLFDSDMIIGRPPAAIAGRTDSSRLRIVPRKRHPRARRFELARIIGGYGDAIARDGYDWMASTDSRTARQKYQRAFAAEFLCPIHALEEFLSGDLSDDAIESAADQFGVSEQTVTAQLMNNHVLPRSASDYGRPYSLVA